jgi:soluble lytic murein transglycosylase
MILKKNQQIMGGTIFANINQQDIEITDIKKRIDNHMVFNFKAVIYIIIAVCSWISVLHADIYKYIDNQGVIHFTNVPVSSGYQLYIKEHPEKDSEPEELAPENSESNLTDKYDQFIRVASERHGIDFFLVKAMIKMESDFDRLAVSRKGAKGLMQIMPFNFNMLKINDPFDPWENIRGGTRYLKILINRFDGKLPLALAAYNAGPGLVDKYRSIPPYTETENYVKKVMKLYNQLTRIR